MNSSSPDLPSFIEGFHTENVKKLHLSILNDNESTSNIKNENNLLRYHRLGKTDMIVSSLSLGGAAFSNFYGDIDIEDCKKCIRYALENGINFVDTSPWYGDSESILGQILPFLPRESFYIATKCGRYFGKDSGNIGSETNDDSSNLLKMFDFSAERIRQSVMTSLQRLKLDYIDLIQIHDLEFAPSNEIIINETIPTLVEMQKEGLVRYIGITGYPLENLKNTVEACKQSDGSNILSSILSYCHCSLLDRSLLDSTPGSLFNKCTEEEVGIINASPLSMGLLTSTGPPAWHPASKYTKLVAQGLAQTCKDNNVKLERLALYYTIIQSNSSFNQATSSKGKFGSGSATTLIGCRTMVEVQDNIHNVMTPLNDKEKRVLTILEKQVKDSSAFLNSSNIDANLRSILDDNQNIVRCNEPSNSNELYHYKHSWEGVELRQYWDKVGKVLMLKNGL